MARQRQPAMDMGGGDTRPWSDVESDDEVGWERSRGLRRMWAVSRWTALVLVCGLGVAVSFAIAIATLLTLLGSSL